MGREEPNWSAPNARGESRARLVLILLLLALAFFKLGYSLQTQLLHPERDGGYYTNIAQNIRDGNGLTTNISLYHKAYSRFPHRTSAYPLWPLVQGLVSRWLPIVKAGVWLPTFFYFSALLFAYLWAQRLLPGPLLDWMPWLRAGHVLVLMLGLHRPFFHFTSLPYTEGLAYALLFAALWRTWSAWKRPGLWSGLELGAWLGVLLLARGQLLLVAFAAFGALFAAAILVEPRSGRLAMLLGAVVSFGAIAVGYWRYLASFVANAGWWSVYRFDLNRESDLLSAVPMLVRVDGLAGFVADRIPGFAVAFSPSGQYAYARSYHVFHYALAIAAPLLVLEGVRRLRGGERGRVWAWLRSASSPSWIFLVLVAAGGLLSIHSLHKVYAQEWNFATRQGLTCLFAFFLGLAYLLKSRWRLAAVVGLCLTLAGATLGFVRVGRMPHRLKAADPAAVGRRPWKPELAAWLMERREEGELTVALSYTWPQRLALSTPGVNYHWVYWNTTRDDVVLMFRKLGVRYLIWERHSRPKPDFLRSKTQFLARFEEIERNLDGFRIFALREGGDLPYESHADTPREMRR